MSQLTNQVDIFFETSLRQEDIMMTEQIPYLRNITTSLGPFKPLTVGKSSIGKYCYHHLHEHEYHPRTPLTIYNLQIDDSDP